MIDIVYAPRFIKQYNALTPALKDEVVKKITLFKNRANHKQLKVHKLKGNMSSYYSFSVTFHHRVVFQFDTSKEAHFLYFGDHQVYQ